MMTAEGNGGAGSPRSDLSESQHWEVIGPDSHSSDGHFIVPKGKATLSRRDCKPL